MYQSFSISTTKKETVSMLKRDKKESPKSCLWMFGKSVKKDFLKKPSFFSHPFLFCLGLKTKQFVETLDPMTTCKGFT